jgi:hypothetical protein
VLCSIVNKLAIKVLDWNLLAFVIEVLKNCCVGIDHQSPTLEVVTDDP